MALFGKSSQTPEANGVDPNLAEEERIAALAKNVFREDPDILAYDEDHLIYERKRKHQEYSLDPTTVVTYDCEEGFRGTRELAIWTPDTGFFGKQRVNEFAPFKVDASFGFSAKENDRYLHLYHDIRNCLNGKVLFFTPEAEYCDIQIDNTDAVLRAFDGKKAQYIQYKDIIGVDLDTNIKILSTEKQHVGRALVGGTDGDNGALGNQSTVNSSTVESYDIVLYINDSMFPSIKKHYAADEGDIVQELFRFLEKLVIANSAVTTDTTAQIVSSEPVPEIPAAAVPPGEPKYDPETGEPLFDTTAMEVPADTPADAPADAPVNAPADAPPVMEELPPIDEMIPPVE